MSALIRPSGALSRWSSIVWKLTVFVGVVVALDGALLIGVTYLGTKAILEEQVYKRLRTVATLRQELLAFGNYSHGEPTSGSVPSDSARSPTRYLRTHWRRSVITSPSGSRMKLVK
jgi:hypothetical protein